MKRSVLLRRVLLAAAVSTLCVILFTIMIFSLVYQIRFVRSEGDDLLAKVRVLGNLVTHWGEKATLEEAVARLDHLNSRDYKVFLSEHTFIYDQSGRLCAMSGEMNDYGSYMEPLVKRALSGEEVLFYNEPVTSFEQVALAGVPLYNGEGKRIGCLFMGESIANALSFRDGTSVYYLIALLMAAPLVTALMMLLMGKIIKPIRQMSEVANAMAAGDYGVRADEENEGEVGQLAHSLNYLCAQLSSKIEEATRERDRIQLSLNSLNEGFMSLRPGGYMYINPALKEMFSDANGHADERLSVVPDERVWQALDDAMEKGQDASLTTSWGEKVYRVTVSSVDPHGAVALFSDVTENERLEKTRREYVANVSHELRSPLTAIRALVEPMRDGMVTSEAARDRYYGIVLDEIERLTRMIDGLLELSRLQSGQTKVELHELGIEQMLIDLAAKYEALAMEKSIRFELFIPQDCPRVLGDEDWIEEVLVILLDNAQKYTPEGGVIRLGARARDKKVEVFVRDSGVGISCADKPYVFDRFYKVDKSHSGGGSGLGLSIAKEILTVMGEEIRVVSSPGKGSEFYFTLSRCDAAASSQSRDTAST